MILDYRDPDALTRVLNALSRDEIFVYPTDTLYGFGGNARSERIMDTICRIKDRPDHMPVSMLVRDIEMLDAFAQVSGPAEKIMEAFLPGALTLVLPARNKDLPERLYSEGEYLGFRIPDHPFCLKMLGAYPAPVISTSVNISGHPAMNTIGEIADAFRKDVELYISDARLDAMKKPAGSTVIRISASDEVSLLREGALPFSEISKLLL